MSFPPSVSTLGLRCLLPLLAALALLSCRDASNSSDAGARRDTAPRVYVLGSTIHLRKAPSPEAESLTKVEIGTECVPLGSAQGEWRKVRCGDKEGYASASLLGAEKPSVDTFDAEARDPQRTLAQREQSALRAAMLVPGDFFRRKQWSDLFFEHNFELLAGSKKPLKGPKLESPCVGRRVADCILESAGLVRGVKSRVVMKERMFVFVVGDSEQIAVYRGQFKYDKEHQSLTEEVLERTRFESAPILEQALFPSAGTADPEDDASSPRLGQFVLDASAQSLMARLPPKWELLKRSDEGAYAVRINGCNGRPYLLRVLPDLHGRWLAVVDAPEALFPDERWVSAVTKTERGTKLTLSRNAEDSAPQVLEIPRVDEAPASLSKAFYTHRSDKYPEVREPCGGRVAGVGPTFSGEFSSEKAMAALYGSVDAADGSSGWSPSGAERRRLLRLEDFWVSGLKAHPLKWEAYREGEQEKMLFLTETYSSDSEPTLIGGGIFSKMEDGWRLERANRVIIVLPHRVDAARSISVQGVGERGVIAVVEASDGGTGHFITQFVLLSDLGGQESIDWVGTLPGSEEQFRCPPGEEGNCYSYDSDWELVPQPEHLLPDVVVTSKGTRPRRGKSEEIESFHELLTFSFSADEYALSSRKDLRQSQE